MRMTQSMVDRMAQQTINEWEIMRTPSEKINYPAQRKELD
jgi:hypothetical protein